MLYKALIHAYANTLTGGVTPSSKDIIAQMIPHIDETAVLRMVRFRKEALSRLQRSRPFFLDADAAAYIATIRESMIDRGHDLLGEIELPTDICYVEYDERQLQEFMNEGGPDSFRYLNWEETKTIGREGILVDNSNPEFLRIQPFMTSPEGALIEPVVDLLFKKDSAGRVTSRITCKPNDHVLQFIQTSLSADSERMQEIIDAAVDGAQDSYTLAYGFFAVLSSHSKDIETAVSETFTSKERKTAKKFGKRHILDAPEQFATIVLGEPGKRYMRQLEEDREDRRAIAEGRKPPVRHKVREHMRRYKSGKVIMVKSFERGHEDDRRPTRVTAVCDDFSSGPDM